MSQQKPERRGDLLERTLGEETLIYDADVGVVHILNVTGQIIWRLCDGTHGVDDMVSALGATFVFGEVVSVRDQVAETLEQLRQKQLLT